MTPSALKLVILKGGVQPHVLLQGVANLNGSPSPRLPTLVLVLKPADFDAVAFVKRAGNYLSARRQGPQLLATRSGGKATCPLTCCLGHEPREDGEGWWLLSTAQGPRRSSPPILETRGRFHVEPSSLDNKPPHRHELSLRFDVFASNRFKHKAVSDESAWACLTVYRATWLWAKRRRVVDDHCCGRGGRARASDSSGESSGFFPLG